MHNTVAECRKKGIGTLNVQNYNSEVFLLYDLVLTQDLFPLFASGRDGFLTLTLPTYI